MNNNLLIIVLSIVLLLLILYKINNESDNIDGFINQNNINKSDYINEYDLHVYDWGAQISIKNIESILNHGDVENDKFIWSRKPKKYSGFYHLDTGSHLLVDMILMTRKDLIKNLNENNVEYTDLIDSGYIYLQGGTPPVSNFQNLHIENKKFNNVPVCLMALDNQHMMEKEREAVNGIFGLSYIGDNHNLSKYSIVNKLLENTNNKTILLDFKNSKMILGSNPVGDYHFKGKILKTSDNQLHRMDVEVIDSDTNKNYNILVDTGTLYSQFEYSGEVLLKGKNTSNGYIKLNNAKILPIQLTGNIKQIILGYNDLYKGSLFLDFNNNMLYINQN